MPRAAIAIDVVKLGMSSYRGTIYQIGTDGTGFSLLHSFAGGTVAEEMVFDDISSGAQNDLERATEIARSMVMDFGMSRLGRVNYHECNRSPFLAGGGDFPRMQSHSEQTAREIDEEAKRIIDEGLERVRHILSKRRSALDATSREQMQQEVIDSTELARIIEENSGSPMIVRGTDSERKRATPTDDSASEKSTGSAGS